ncbi:MAG: epimerase [Bacteroidia bacterium]|nr:epimerase [Bacteroidia bacterium]
MKIRAIITGVTGMVGEGVLHECLLQPDIEAVLVIGRRPCNIHHPKISEIIHKDFYDFSSIEDKLKGYNACFFCLGVSSVGMKEDEYHRLTYDLTMAFAKTLLKQNPDMTFCYVSGANTDSSEKGRSNWARVKGKTENHLLKLGFHKAYMFRPGYIQPTPGLKNAYKIYRVLAPLYPVWKLFFRKYVSTLEELGLSMINAVRLGYEKQVLEVPDIVSLSNR